MYLAICIFIFICFIYLWLRSVNQTSSTIRPFCYEKLSFVLTFGWGCIMITLQVFFYHCRVFMMCLVMVWLPAIKVEVEWVHVKASVALSTWLM